MPGISIFISGENFMLSYVQQERICTNSFLLNIAEHEICDLLPAQISCSAELSMKKFYNLGARLPKTPGRLGTNFVNKQIKTFLTKRWD